MRIIKLIAVALFLSATSVYAETPISSKDKVDIFKECQGSCVDKQNRSALNKAFQDLPFLIENYCGCYCTRLAMRISEEDIWLTVRLMLVERKTLDSNKRIQKLMEENGKVCFDAIFN